MNPWDFEPMHQQRGIRRFRCAHCTRVAGVDGYRWSRLGGISCKNCRRITYLIAVDGPSPYRDWPLQGEAPLTEREVLGLFADAEDDGMVFLTPEDLRLHERIMARGRRARSA